MFIKISYRLFFVLLILMAFSASAENTQQKQSKLQKKINSASATLKNSRAVSKKLRKSVIIAEDKLNKLSRDLYQTEQKINSLTTKLNKSNAKKKKLQKQTNAQQQALAQQMQALYTSGKQSHLRLLLKQDDPSDISRTVKYFEYMNKHRLKRIKKIKKRLNKIKVVQEQIAKDTKTLQALQIEQGNKKIALKSAVKEKNKLLKKQSKIVNSQAQMLSKLKKDESRLRGVLQRLANKQKQEEKAAKIKAQRKKEAIKLAAKTGKKVKPEPISAKRRFVSNKPFSSLRGKLSWPVRGKLTHRYGSARNSKINWNGVIITAAAGTKVHAVARGKVEFSGRLNGYGYVIIIRHDKSYRSLYAFNRSVYKKVGQIVKQGDVIAAVGSSGRLTNPGLYFEISRGSRHQNPARWCR